MDRRVEKTERAFTEALFYFLEQKELNKITVKELCEYADMNRGTFYLHYYDIYDLMDKTEDKMIDMIFDDPSEVSDSIPRNVLKTFECIKKHKDKYKILFTSRNMNDFTNKLCKKIMLVSKQKLTGTLPGVDEKVTDNIALFYVGGAIALLYGWVVENGCSTSPMELFKAASYLSDFLYAEKQRHRNENPDAL